MALDKETQQMATAARQAVLRSIEEAAPKFTAGVVGSAEALRNLAQAYALLVGDGAT